nr:glycosyl hydrolase [Duganella aceris]
MTPVVGVTLAAALLIGVAGSPAAQTAATPIVSNRIADVAAHLAAPPDDARPMVRWWWFGPAVVKPQLERELLAMKAGGFGGVEIQPVYPMELDDPARGIKNLPYLSTEFLDAVSFVNRKARAEGMRVDMTLASGWPYGGPHVPVTESAGRLRLAVAELAPGATAAALPAIMSGETLLATFIGPGTSQQYDATKLAPAIPPGPGGVGPGRIAVTASNEPRVVAFYIASRTGQQVKRAALGAEGFVLDHLSRKAIDHHLNTIAEPLLKAFGDQPPYAVFSDSLEVYGTDWTDDFLGEFQRRRGYDLKPHLPLIYSGQGDKAAALRHDWVQTQTELVNERYLTPVNDWARAHNTRFRSQTYGEPAVSMSSNRLVALPEGEGPQFRSFSFTRLATSAGHLYDRPVISAETWTWLHSPAFSATPLDMKAEADRMLLQGVNQFIGHGWPYTPPGLPEPGYAFYAAAVFNNHQPWWNVMPDVNAYLSRTSYLLRQGRPANDVAVLLPNDDVYAAAVPGKVSLSAEMHHYVTPQLTEQILDAGHNLDYVDAESILALGITHPVLVMPHVTRLSPAVLAKLADYVRGGGKIIAVGAMPSMAPGFAEAQRISAQVVAASKGLLGKAGVQLVADDAGVGAALGKALQPDIKVAAQAADVGFIHRKLADGDIYFIANTSNRDVRTSATLRAPRKVAAWWNPYTGKTSAATVRPALDLTLAPYESRVLVLTDSAPPAPPVAAARAAPPSSIVAGATPQPSVAAGATPLPSVVAGAAPLPSVATGAMPSTSVAAGAMPLPSVAVGARPQPSVAAGATPLPSVATGAMPPTSVAAGATPLPSVAAGATPQPSVAAGATPLPSVATGAMPPTSVAAGATPLAGARQAAVLADLSRDWQVRFAGAGEAQAMPTLRSWTDDPAKRFFSGVATYSKDIALTAAQLQGQTIRLDFGPGTPLDTTPKVPSGMRAMLESPIREAAEVYVNGQRAGAIWHPPYELDITSQLQAGANKIDIKVANLSLNALAGQERPDYRLLSARYGQRFVPQDTHLIVPQPSGILGPVRLLTQPESQP